MKTEKKKTEIIEMMTLEIAIIIISSHMRIKKEKKTEMIEMITLEIEKRKNRRRKKEEA